mmetsp:Transcript_5763/g.8180  ORF Transcript_5763/g.8180 Transcript_5763/m.8180 type:complete len:531 (-) Transcript_5763:1699-3291(-)|eukprot:CAMPEP_0194038536 /NCGR_PEP_ID=MMETSP0009_2-20130614/10759_1 /TAXON_ID=210454 /ORGANISM="Grammatophora oceanica, Strain CCMP 410" /LENGTH=530 /DNA_ID=CAMNT_0038681061 /DNA_START=6 /DNA_END=1598 /DNA_ORIENTATION=+
MRASPWVLTLLFLVDSAILSVGNGDAGSTAATGTPLGPGLSVNTDEELMGKVVKEIQTNHCMGGGEATSEQLSFPNIDIESALDDFGLVSTTNDHEDGETNYSGPWTFLCGLASSPTFLEKFWHRKPLLLKAAEIQQPWIPNSFTVEDHLKLIDGSYISGHCTGDRLRTGEKTDTWEFKPLKTDLTRPTTWKEVEEALEGGTIYFNTAGSLWPTLGALCRLTNAAFGLPSNVNVYVTPPHLTLSVPPHTDRQDVLCFQTQGKKRWRVYGPPPRRKNVDPLNRGKNSDVLSFDELDKEPLLDCVLEPGDVLYVPTGFPHTTDTVNGIDVGSKDMSVHLTMGLDTHVWGMTLAHLRWCVLQRTNKDFQLNIQDDEAYWEAMDAIPVGFLVPSRSMWKDCLASLQVGTGVTADYKEFVTDKLKAVMMRLQPPRWKSEENVDGEELPTDEDFSEVLDFMIGKHLTELMSIQDELFRDTRMKDEASLMKAFKCAQKQNKLMEEFGAFSKNAAMRDSFAQRRQMQAAAVASAKSKT